ncbi:ATP-binding protein [Schlesneria paludicola]|uniref:ATP-binding protein n=1 Tax=Schlesneria paludicola TaxID=360056 RepID=UPI00029A6460|nr:ferredoxin family protein [Schlesneria paludicola]
MAGRKLTVVISQAPGKNPVKRQLEEEIATQLMLSGTAEVSIVPNLYDLTHDHTGMLWLKSLKGHLVVLGWLYPRAIRWVLDRNGVKGQVGESRLNVVETDDEADLEEEAATSEAAAPQGIGAVNVPNRLIYAIDLRNDPSPKTYLDEIERLSKSLAAPLVQLTGLFGDSLNAFGSSSNGSNGHASSTTNANRDDHSNGESAIQPTDSPINSHVGLAIPGSSPPAAPAVLGGDITRRRWYPVIDYSRCTNCMECLDFCLFGVYGVDLLDRILVEQEDNCKKGCPACSRVCPANAIVFPEHKTPAIAGAEGGTVDDFKIDLSKLFGAPSALEMAVLERDTELVADGRDAVGVSVGLPKRQTGTESAPRDDLDDLMDGLDSLDL